MSSLGRAISLIFMWLTMAPSLSLSKSSVKTHRVYSHGSSAQAEGDRKINVFGAIYYFGWCPI